MCQSLDYTDDGRNFAETSASYHKRLFKRKIHIILLRVNSFSKKFEVLEKSRFGRV